MIMRARRTFRTRLCSVVLTACMVGSLLPILAKRLGTDPAVMASPLITTVVDAMSLLIYFQLSSWLLGL